MRQHAFVGRQVAAVGLLGDDPQRAPLAGAADDDRHPPDRPRIAGRLGQVHIAAVVGLGAGRPECAQRLDADLQLVKPLVGVREVQSVRLVLAQPPTGPQPAERAAAAQRIQRRHRLGDDPGARKVTGETSVPSRSLVSRPASSPRVTHGSGIGSHARSTCGIWIRWSIRAMPSKPIDVRGQGEIDQPAGRVLAPRKAGDLQDHPRTGSAGHSTHRSQLGRASGLASGAGLLDDQDLGPSPRRGRRADHRLDPAQLLGDHRRRYGTIPVPVALPAEPRAGCS